MKKLLCLLLLAGFLAAALSVARNAEARPPCPPGYFWDGPRGCMPMPYYPPPAYYPPPPAYYYPPPPAYVPPLCPPGTFWRAGACRPVPPPPAPGVRVYLPPLYIGP